MHSNEPERKQKSGISAFAIKRTILGIVAVVCLACWIFFYFAWGWDEVVRSAGIAIIGRIGLVLLVIWIALPPLQPIFRHASSLAIGGLLVILLFLVLRPKIVPIVVAVVVGGLAINWILRVLAGTKKGKRVTRGNRGDS